MFTPLLSDMGDASSSLSALLFSFQEYGRCALISRKAHNDQCDTAGNRARHRRPKAEGWPASFQPTQTTNPPSNPAMTPVLVAFFQNKRCKCGNPSRCGIEAPGEHEDVVMHCGCTTRSPARPGAGQWRRCGRGRSRSAPAFGDGWSFRCRGRRSAQIPADSCPPWT